MSVGACTRSGSHNLIVGTNNAYSASGGIVSGNENTLGGDLAVLLGGQKNSFVSAGISAAIVGGKTNEAKAFRAVVAGGDGNIVSGKNSAIIGGFENKATDKDNVVAGGSKNTASGRKSAHFGGKDLTADAEFDVEVGPPVV